MLVERSNGRMDPRLKSHNTRIFSIYGRADDATYHRLHMEGNFVRNPFQSLERLRQESTPTSSPESSPNPTRGCGDDAHQDDFSHICRYHDWRRMGRRGRSPWFPNGPVSQCLVGKDFPNARTLQSTCPGGGEFGDRG